MAGNQTESFRLEQKSVIKFLVIEKYELWKNLLKNA